MCGLKPISAALLQCDKPAKLLVNLIPLNDILQQNVSCFKNSVNNRHTGINSRYPSPVSCVPQHIPLILDPVEIWAIQRLNNSSNS